MNLRILLENERKRLTNIPWETIELDYCLTWILWGLSSVDILKNNMVFKGGTALKKLYFGDYRFSEDLDFTALEDLPQGDELEKHILLACQTTQTAMEEFFPTPVITLNRYTEKQPHPEGQEAFCIRIQLPWHRHPHVKVMIEITRKERLVTLPVFKEVRHSYESFINSCSVKAYTIEEIAAEKLRSILQNTKKLHENTWGRSRVRDYYDLWNIFSSYEKQLRQTNLKTILEKKCLGKGVAFKSVDDFFDHKNMSRVEKEWGEWLSPLINHLPAKEKVIDDLESQINTLFTP